MCLIRDSASGLPESIPLRKAPRIPRPSIMPARQRASPASGHGNSGSRSSRFPGHPEIGIKGLSRTIILPDGRSLNEQLLQQGMASFYAHKNLPSQLVRRLTAAQKDALDKRAGCWGFILTRPQAQEPYIGNRNSKRFFSKACLRTANISKKNQIRFSDLEEAFRSGYAPARPCGIWPSAE